MPSSQQPPRPATATEPGSAPAQTAQTAQPDARRRSLLLRAALWCQAKLPPDLFLFSLAGIIGISAGFGAGLLKLMIGSVSEWIRSILRIDGFNWILLVLPLAGIMITGLFQRDIVHRKLEHGVPQLLNAIRKGNYTLPRSAMILPMIANAITLGFGGSAGAEGPIAYSSSAIGSNLGRWLGLPQRMILILIGCGAGAGIAGIFKAPLGGVLFTLEVMRLEMSTVSVIALFIASLAGGITAYVSSGMSLDVDVTSPIAFDPSTTLWFAILGGFCGLYSLYYTGVMKHLGHYYEGMTNQWLRNLLSGGVLALTIFLFPALYGEGYNIISTVLDGNIERVVDFSVIRGHEHWIPLAAATGVMLLKAVAACSTTSGGGVAGDFAPTLFAGCVAGLVFAEAVNLTGLGMLPTGIFALCGMAAVMAGAIRAPLMAIFIVAEMTGYYGLLFPLTVAAITSYITVRFFNHEDYFHRLHWIHPH